MQHTFHTQASLGFCPACALRTGPNFTTTEKSNVTKDTGVPVTCIPTLCSGTMQLITSASALWLILFGPQGNASPYYLKTISNCFQRLWVAKLLTQEVGTALECKDSEQWKHLGKKKENSLTCQILSENSNAVVSPIMGWPVQVVLSVHFLVSLCIPIQELMQYSQ